MGLKDQYRAVVTTLAAVSPRILDHAPSVRSWVWGATLVALITAGAACRPPVDSGSQTSSGSLLTTPAAPSTQVSTVRPAPPTSTSASAPSTTLQTTLPPLAGLAYQPVADLSFPTMMTARPGDEVALVAQRSGPIRTLSPAGLGDVILDLSDSTTTEGERGLLGLARHPHDGTRLFVHYTDRNGDTVISEFTLGKPIEMAPIDRGTERVLLMVDQPASNHNGGMIQFGPDGALYVGLGDGGGAGDRYGNGQNQDTLLGGIVRLDVDTGEAILWQYGLRNPWRFWIDGDQVWIGDVGQNSYEEIDLASITDQGLNFGWPIVEGNHCYGDQTCDTSGLTMPLVEIPRSEPGTCSITGGLVYRGEAIPELTGRFLFSDFCAGFLRSVDSSGEVEDHTDEVGVRGQVVSFGVDGVGEAYVLTTGQILKLVPVR